ncbi:MAG: ABC transporter ATP-binding protein [Xanthomonadaceae bacterium]|nr:ABC transporter ATP-binding protein [Xanthomonadaceae bacterium]
MAAAAEPILVVDDLNVSFDTRDGELRAVRGLDFALYPGETLGIIGESGAGKSQAVLAVLGLLPTNGRATGSARYRGRELIGMPGSELNAVRGARIALVFQDPMSSLNPYLRIRTQMVEVLAHHAGLRGVEARRRAVAMLEAVRIPDAVRVLERYPHEFSGGMRQRVMIAMALLCDPDILVADEPTTALDVTVQAQVLEILRDLQRSRGIATLLITHDLGVVAGQCDRVLVMYAGRIVESGSVDGIFNQPQHPYTADLLRSIPRLDRQGRLNAIAGDPPDPMLAPPGCPYAPRCSHRFERCDRERPLLGARLSGAAACHLDAAGD